MTSTHFRAIVTARHRCEVNPQMHVGRPIGIRRKGERRWWRFGR